MVCAMKVSLMVLFSLFLADVARPVAGYGGGYVQEACSVTRYRDLCVRSLAPFSSTAKRSPSKWARAGVSVTLREVKGTARYLQKVKASGSVRGRNGVALSDCLQCFQDAIDNLHQSLGTLRRLNIGEFEAQMSDLITWMSAALTDEDTCLEGFDATRFKQVQDRVQRVTYFTSNALALANKLASTGLPA